MARSSSKGEQMTALLAEWRRSGESAAAFCRRRAIRPQKLSYWKRVLGVEGGRRRSRAGSVAGFVPVELVGAAASSAVALEIHLAGGERVVFPQGGSLAQLREVLAVLRERC